MAKCDRCGTETNLFCAKCKPKIEAKYRKFIPLLYWDTEENTYRFACSVVECPCNEGNGMCSTRHLSLPIQVMHDYDGDNIIHQPCG